MAYRDYLTDFAKRFSAKFDEIAAHHNLELGDEFEIAVCEALRTVLPNRFGVCRGFIVTDGGAKAGDDIIIFDREHYPTLRLLPQNTFGRLEDIPVEAVCGYFEGKHTLYAEPSKAETKRGTGPNLETALSQIKAIRSLDRKKVPLDFLGTFTRPKKSNGLTLSEHNPVMPDHLNPLFVGIISRFARKSEDNPAELSVADMATALQRYASPASRPDLIVAGANLLLFPAIPAAAGTASATFASPFYLEGVSGYAIQQVDSLAWGIGVALLLEALNLIELGKVSWGSVALDALNLSSKERGILTF